MKRFFIASAVISAVFALMSCSKDNGNGGKKDEGPVATKVEFCVEWQNLSSDILDNFDIVFSGVDFDGKSFEYPFTQSGSKTFTTGKVEIKDIEDHCPFSFEMTATPKKEFADKESYDSSHEYLVKALFYDAAGNKLPCSESKLENGYADEVYYSYSNAPVTSTEKLTAKANFQKEISRAFTNTKRTFVFFRHGATLKFTHTTQK